MNQTIHLSSDHLAQLQKEVQSLSGVVLSNPIIPILENFLLEADAHGITLTASNQQVILKSHIPLASSLAHPFRLAVPADLFKETLRALARQPVRMTLDDEMYALTLHTDNGHYKLACEAATDFPLLPEPVGQDEHFQMEAATLKKAISCTLFAASKDKLRPALTGLYLQRTETGLAFVATDAHRLACFRMQPGAGKPYSCILPAKAPALLRQLLSSQPGEQVEIRLGSKQVFFSFGNLRMTVSLLQETYPDYARVMPLHNELRLTCNGAACLAALRRISLFANRTSQQVKFILRQGEVEIAAEDFDFSNAGNEKITATYTRATDSNFLTPATSQESIAPQMDIAFNAKLLIEMLATLVSSSDEATPTERDMTQVVFQIKNATEGVLIVPQADEKESQPAEGAEEYRMLIMPSILMGG